ncbi:MAG: hypothetical protein MUC43_15440 [Pirellula sp.]|jgi:hypothetical protein|nr:hypothetical protein [Pirellula sp.]
MTNLFGQQNNDYPEPLLQIKKLYAAPTRFDEEFVSNEAALFQSLAGELEKKTAVDVVASIDFDDPFESFYLLGYCFSTQRDYRRSITSEVRSRIYVAMFNRCVKEQGFRRGVVRYFVWTKNLHTEFKRERDFVHGLTMFHNYLKNELPVDGIDVCERAFISLVYMELFGYEFDNKIASFEQEKLNRFEGLNRCRSDLIELVHERKFEILHGHLYRPTESTERDRTIIIDEKEVRKFADRIPNSIAPLFPTEKLSVELQNFLDLHEINRGFCWSL